jgi:hypothetical protein
MLVLDASGIVHGWDNYPLVKFPKLWDWIESEIVAGNLLISIVAYTEVTQVSPECASWLDNVNIQKSNITRVMLAQSLAYKAALGVVGEGFHANGVDEKDLMIIANAQVLGFTLISNEAVQNSPPQLMTKYKIPAVCVHIANVKCINFLSYINSANATF